MFSTISKRAFVMLFCILFCAINYYILLRGLTSNGCNFFDHKEETFRSKEESSFIEIQNGRLDWIKHVCSQQNQNLSLNQKTNGLANSSFWLIKEHIVYCPIFKSASSTWLTFLYNLAITNNSGANRLSKEKYTRTKACNN